MPPLDIVTLRTLYEITRRVDCKRQPMGMLPFFDFSPYLLVLRMLLTPADFIIQLLDNTGCSSFRAT